jgi:hypothetical protein
MLSLHLVAQKKVPFPLLPSLIDPSRSLDMRFTRTSTSFFIISLLPPSSATFSIPARLPIRKGDRVFLLCEKEEEAEEEEEEEVEWELKEPEGGTGKEGVLEIGLGEERKRKLQGVIAWVLEVRYGG